MWGPVGKDHRRPCVQSTFKLCLFDWLSSINNAVVDIKHGCAQRVYEDGLEMALFVSSVVPLPTKWLAAALTNLPTLCVGGFATSCGLNLTGAVIFSIAGPSFNRENTLMPKYDSKQNLISSTVVYSTLAKVKQTTVLLIWMSRFNVPVKEINVEIFLFLSHCS